MVVYIDIHGALADYNHGVQEIFHTPENWKSVKDSFEDKSLFNKPIEARGVTFWSNLRPYGNARRFMSAVGKLLSWGSVRFTSNYEGVDMISGSLIWLRRHMPAITMNNIALVKQKAWLSRSNAVLIDDNEVSVKAFRDMGGHAILFPRPWNRLNKLYSQLGEDKVYDYVIEQLTIIVEVENG